jgi:hypothetical protein
LGWWSVWLVVACLALFVVGELMVGSLGAENQHALAIALTALIGVVAAGALATGTISVVRNGERSIIVFIVMALGLYQAFGAVVALLGLP